MEGRFKIPVSGQGPSCAGRSVPCVASATAATTSHGEDKCVVWRLISNQISALMHLVGAGGREWAVVIPQDGIDIDECRVAVSRVNSSNPTA